VVTRRRRDDAFELRCRVMDRRFDRQALDIRVGLVR
jgi:hypothetical protein